MALRVVLEGDAANAADVDAEQVDSRSRRQSAHRLVEDHPHRHRDAVWRRKRRATIGKKREHGVLGRLRRACQVRRRIEGETAGEHRGEGLRVDAQSAGVQRQVDAARVPETAVQGDELLVRRLDEDLQRQLVALGVERVADDPADRRAAMKHRRADVERAEVLGAQDEDRAGLAAQHERRRFEADEDAARLVRDAGIGADVGAREQRAQAAHAAGADARPHDPERGVLDREARRRAIELDDDADALAVVAQGDRKHLADHDLLVADLGLAGFDPVGRLELDLDAGADQEDRPHQHRGGDRDRDERHQPDERDVPAPRLDDARRRKVRRTHRRWTARFPGRLERRVRRVFFHRAGSAGRADRARSGGGRTTRSRAR
jgi:hypothetical protein